MRIIEKTFEKNLDESQLAVIDSATLLFDIESTGLSSKYCYVYAIGCAYYKAGILHFIQYFGEGPADESLIIEEFIRLSSGFGKYISFNGQNFDIRFLTDRANALSLQCNISAIKHLDLYRMIMPYKKLLGFSSLRQKYLEEFLCSGRKDDTNGGELTCVYKEFLENSDANLLKILMQHNEEDVLGLVELCKLYSYISLFDDSTEKEGNLAEITDKECIYSIMLTHPLPKSINILANSLYLHAERKNAYLKIPVYKGKLKFFFDDYKNYWYYPEEDRAIHSSLAVYGEKSHRIKATAKTAYITKTSSFLPSYGYGDELFYDEYKGKAYIELSDKIKTPGNYLTGYLNHLISSFKG